MTRTARGLLYWGVPHAARPRLPAVLLAGALLAGVPACSGGTAATSAVALPTATPTVPAVPATGPSTAPAAATPAVADEVADLVLQGDGLSLLQGDTPQPLPFATASAGAVRAALSAALGDVTETAAVPCPQGPRTRLAVDGFSVLLDGDHFVGWTDVGAPDRALTTDDGVGTGTRLADLRSALPGVQVPAGGTTWASAGGLSGTLSGSDPAAQVAVISAGQTCPP